MHAQSSLEYLFVIGMAFVMIFIALFAYNTGYVPHALRTSEDVDKLQLQNDAQYIVVRLNSTGRWEDLKSKSVSLSESGGKTTCTVPGTPYSGTYSGSIGYDTTGKTLEGIYNDCMDGNAEACRVIICALGR